MVAGKQLVAHEMILASAGSGKTHALTTRFIRLLAHGVKPERIIALTFSRKSAAEFFSKILSRLASAAAHPAAAEKLGGEIDRPELGTAGFTEMLGALVEKIHLLALGTLDSFFVRAAKVFPFELGLGGDFSILDEHAMGVERRRIYQRLFQARPTLTEEQREFIWAFHQATFGAEENRLLTSLDSFIDGWHDWYLAAPEEEKWGREEVIWPQGLPWSQQAGKLEERITEVEAIMERECRQWTEGQTERLQVFCEAMHGHSAGAPLPKAAKYMMERLLPILSELRAGSAEFVMERKKVKAGVALCEGLFRLLTHWLRGEYEALLHKTQGIWKIVQRYDCLYHEMVRRQGQLTFSDVQLILSGALPGAPSGMANGNVDKLALDYRLDARFDHWLLDEFQDTSGVQWRILHNLIDEIIQDDSGQRSFFAVGDTKQSIYGFRGAEPWLFFDILRHYNQGESQRIHKLGMARSYRSAPPVLDMVNEIFLRREVLEGILPVGALSDWEFERHTPARPELSGCAEVIQTPPAEKGSGATKDDLVYTAVCAKLREIDPLRRGLSCAVLVLTNKHAQEIADFIRAETRWEVVTDSNIAIAADNPACQALLALLQAAAHPLDEFAWRHVLMTPLRNVLKKLGMINESESVGRTATHVLRSVAERGFEKTIRWWTQRLQHHVPSLDSFSQGRLKELAACAFAFDATGSRDMDEFLQFAAGWRISNSANPAAIQVLTVWKAKGLGFDVVMLADLHEGTHRLVRDRVAVQRNTLREIEWLVKMPNKDLSDLDPTLSGAMAKLEARLWQDNLSKLYVAVTRAIRGNYLFLPPPIDSESRSLQRLLRSTLRGQSSQRIQLGEAACERLWLAGNPDWYADIRWSREETEASKEIPIGQMELFLSGAAPKPHPNKRDLKRKRPSDSGLVETLFSPPDRQALALGQLVHELFAAIEWVDHTTGPTLEEMLTAVDPELAQAARQQVANCLQAASLQRYFQAQANVTVWRERRFEDITEGTWTSGVFDRVLIYHDATGRADRAVLIDYKTDALLSGEKAEFTSHSEQLGDYREKLAKLLQISPQSITPVIIFTRRAEAVVPKVSGE